MSYELLLARRRILMASNRVWPTLLYLSEAEVSMCCKDGTDGKGGVFQLHPFFDDGLDHKSQCTWTTSDASRATVNGSGLVSFSAATSYGDVMISCIYRGVVKTCLLTVYETMPNNNAALLNKKGGCGWWAFTTSIPELKTVSGLEAHLIAGRQIRGSSSERGFKSVVNANSASSISVDEAALGSCWVNKCSYSGTTRTIVSYNGFSYRGTGTLIIEAYTTNGTTLNVNGDEDSIYYYNTTSDSTPSYISLAACSSSLYGGRKRTWQSNAPTGTSKSDLWNPSKCRLCHCSQNYIKYTDRDTWVNYTVIPNIGTLGSAFDLPSNNVPSAWFGV